MSSATIIKKYIVGCPAGTSEQEVAEIIKLNDGNDMKINAAISDLWDHHSEWVSADKKVKKKVNVATKPSQGGWISQGHSRGSEGHNSYENRGVRRQDSGGGGAGRGNSAPPGRSFRGPRGSGGRGISVGPSKVNNQSSSRELSEPNAPDHDTVVASTPPANTGPEDLNPTSGVWAARVAHGKSAYVQKPSRTLSKREESPVPSSAWTPASLPADSAWSKGVTAIINPKPRLPPQTFAPTSPPTHIQSPLSIHLPASPQKSDSTSPKLEIETSPMPVREESPVHAIPQSPVSSQAGSSVIHPPSPITFSAEQHFQLPATLEMEDEREKEFKIFSEHQFERQGDIHSPTNSSIILSNAELSNPNSIAVSPVLSPLIQPAASPILNSAVSPAVKPMSPQENVVVERLKMGKWGQNLCYDDRDINLSFSFGSLDLDPAGDSPIVTLSSTSPLDKQEGILSDPSTSNISWENTVAVQTTIASSVWEKEVKEGVSAEISSAGSFPSPTVPEPVTQISSNIAPMVKSTPPGFSMPSTPQSQSAVMSPIVGSSSSGPPPGLPLLSKPLPPNEVEKEAEVLSKVTAAQHQAIQMQMQKQEQYQAQQQAIAAQQAQLHQQQQSANMQMHQHSTNSQSQPTQAQNQLKQENPQKPKKDPGIGGFHGNHKPHSGSYSPANVSQHPQGGIQYGQSSNHNSMGVVPPTGYGPPPGMTSLPQAYGGYTQGYNMYGGYQNASYFYPPQQQHYQSANGFSQQAGSRGVYHGNIQPRGPYPNEFGQNGGVMGYNLDHQYPPSHYGGGQDFGMNGGGPPQSQQVGSGGAPGLGNEKSQQVLNHPGIGAGMYHSAHYGQPGGGHSMGVNDPVPGWSPQAAYNSGGGGHHAPSSQPQGGGSWNGNMGPQNSGTVSHGQYHPHHPHHAVSTMGQHPYNAQYPGSGGDNWARS